MPPILNIIALPPADVLPSPLTPGLWMVVGSQGTPLLSSSPSSAASLLNMDAAAVSVSVSLYTVGSLFVLIKYLMGSLSVCED